MLTDRSLYGNLFIPLDIFRKNLHNKGIRNQLDAWLTFLAVDETESIIKLIEEYPEFKAMYEEVYEICQNVESVMEMFSKELLELDRHTVQYMIDEMQNTIDAQKEKMDEMQEKLQNQQEQITQAIQSAICIMRKLNMPEKEIIGNLQK